MQFILSTTNNFLDQRLGSYIEMASEREITVMTSSIPLLDDSVPESSAMEDHDNFYFWGDFHGETKLVLGNSLILLSR